MKDENPDSLILIAKDSGHVKTHAAAEGEILDARAQDSGRVAEDLNPARR